MSLTLGAAVDACSAEVTAVAHAHGGIGFGRRGLVNCGWGEEGIPRSCLERNAGLVVVVEGE